MTNLVKKIKENVCQIWNGESEEDFIVYDESLEKEIKNQILTENEVEQAIEWYKFNDIKVERTDFKTGSLLSILTYNGIRCELSIDEIKYRATLNQEREEEEQ